MHNTAEDPARRRWRPLKATRNYLRDLLFRWVRKVQTHDRGREVAAIGLKGLLREHPATRGVFLANRCSPYTELGHPVPDATALRSDPVFITARFRSGSTLLWNLFRHIPGMTSYYEPLNERRWFDPVHRGGRIDATHRFVTDYWREYEGLTELGRLYQEEWVRRHLFMDPHFWDPNLKRYIEVMIERAPGRPVLQFNRVDFRLPWLRRTFPHARIVHLYRHPRDQWCSALVDIKKFTKDDRVERFLAHDHFYLMMWAQDLKLHFPFLDPTFVRHPYELFYYIWKLSYLFGVAYSHYSLAFEDLLAAPEQKMDELMAVLGVAQYPKAELLALVDRPASGRWREYAEESWFVKLETRCESELAEYLSAD